MKKLFALTFVTLFIALAATSCVSKSETTTTTDSTTVDSTATDSVTVDTVTVK